MSFKAQELAHNLASELKIRFGGPTSVPALFVTESFDSNGDPTISIGPVADVGAGAADTRSAIIRVKAIDWPLAKDVLGLATTIYTPHVIQLLTEATNDDVADGLTAQDTLTLIAAISKRGTLVEWYNTADGTAVTVAGVTSGNLKASYDAEMYWNMLASQ